MPLLQELLLLLSTPAVARLLRPPPALPAPSDEEAPCTMAPPPPPPPAVFQLPLPLATLLPFLRWGAWDCRRRAAREPRGPGRLWAIGDDVCRSAGTAVGNDGGIQACLSFFFCGSGYAIAPCDPRGVRGKGGGLRVRGTYILFSFRQAAA